MSRASKLIIAAVLAAFCSCTGASTSQAGTVDITENGPDGLPGIFWLIKQRDQAAVGAWLDAGGDIEVPGFHRATPVLAAAIIDDWPMVLYLIERGAQMNVSDRRGYTLAYRATTTRIDPEGILGPALRMVLQRLEQASEMEEIFTPTEVREMVSAGRWPPVR
ncbi:MAG: hypothetical protein JJU15_02715 [Pararhodobacter sp.]|nr:hypothetical protein [Pararhodobacter sp.]